MEHKPERVCEHRRCSIPHRLPRFLITARRSIVIQQMCRTTYCKDLSRIVLQIGGGMAPQRNA
eukprot:12301109-Prorocentrum_lima.AAC.1